MIENDPVLDQLDAHAQKLRTEFFGPDYIPDEQHVFDEDQIHAELLFLENSKGTTVNIEDAEFDDIEDAIEDLSDTMEDGLDSLTQTLLQRKEDDAVHTESTRRNLPVALLGAPQRFEQTEKLLPVVIDGQTQAVEQQDKQLGELVDVRDVLEDILIENRLANKINSTTTDEQEQEDFNAMRQQILAEEQIKQLEDLNKNFEDFSRNGGGGSGGGIFDSIFDMFGGGGSDGKDGKDGKGGKDGKRGKGDNGVNRRGKKGKFFKALKGMGWKGKVAAGLGGLFAYNIFDDFIFGEGGVVDATTQTMFGDEQPEAKEQAVSDAKKKFDDAREEQQKIETIEQTTDIKDNSAMESQPFSSGLGIAGAALGTGLVASKVMTERTAMNPMYGTKGGLANMLMSPSAFDSFKAPTSSVPALPAPTTSVPKATSGLWKQAKGIGKKLPGLNALMAGFDAYNVVSDENKSVSEKVAGLGGIGGGMAGASMGGAAGAALGSVIPIFGTAIGGLAGSMLGYYGGSEMVEGGLNWLLGNGDEEKPEQIKAADVKPQTEWWNEDPEKLVRNDDGSVSIGGKHFRDEKSYLKIRDARMKASETNNVNTTTTTASTDVITTDEVKRKEQVEVESKEATDVNTDAIEKLTDALASASFGLLGLGGVASAAGSAWDWVKGMFSDEPETQTSVENKTVKAGLVTPEDAAVPQVVEQTAQQAKAKELEARKNKMVTSAAEYVNAYNEKTKTDKTISVEESKEFAPAQVVANLEEATSAISTYSQDKRGYDTWLDDFGREDVTYQQFLKYFDSGAHTQFVGGTTVTPPAVDRVATTNTTDTTTSATAETNTETSTAEANRETVETEASETNQNTESVITKAATSKEEVTNNTVETPMDGIKPDVQYSHDKSVWYNWANADSAYGNHLAEQVNPKTDTTEQVYSIDQDPTSNIVEADPQDIVAPRHNFVEARQTISEVLTDVGSSATVEKKSIEQKREGKTTREKSVTSSTNRGAGKTAKPRISDVPIVIDDSGLTALNLGYL